MNETLEIITPLMTVRSLIKEMQKLNLKVVKLSIPLGMQQMITYDLAKNTMDGYKKSYKLKELFGIKVVRGVKLQLTVER